MILVGQYDSPFVRRVAVTLHHYGMPFDRNMMSVFRNAARMQKINPLIRVPSLILESGEVLIDSGAILDHLDELAQPARALVPPHGPERRKVLQAMAFTTGICNKAVALFYERYFHPGKKLSQDYEKRCLNQIKAGLAHLEQQCGAPWFIDEHMTQADVTIGCMIGYLKLRLPQTFPLRKFPKLHALALHCELRPEFARARPAPEETVPGVPPRKARSRRRPGSAPNSRSRAKRT